MSASEEPIGPVIRDNRRIDPVTGQPKRGKHAASQPAGATGAGRPGGAGAGGTGTASNRGTDSPASAPAAGADAPESVPAESAGTQAKDVTAATDLAAELRDQLAERTADLQRLQAEYANYRKRVDRDRATVREQAITGALTELLPVLDAISQAREHGELSGGFKSVADALQAGVSKLGLVSYGQRGDAFDPKIHEALSYTDSPDVAEDTCVEIYQPGYKVGERIMRPARVAVAAPASGPGGDGSSAEWPAAEENN
jgi:molecular chaperone GrpE